MANNNGGPWGGGPRRPGVSIMRTHITTYESDEQATARAVEESTDEALQTCPECGGGLAVQYADELASVDCRDCGERTAQFPVPVGLLDSYAREEVPAAVDAWFRVLLRQVTAGVCPICTGRLDAHLDAPDEAVGDADVLHSSYTCRRCDERVVSVLGGFLLEHPAVVAFLYEHGVDTRDQPFWTFEWLFDPDTTELLDDPRRARLAVPAPDGDAHLTLTVDEDLDVTDATRT